MKTYEIKDLLKKELLIIELPENGYYKKYRDGIEVRDFLTDEVLTLANYTLLGSPDEIKEEDVKDLVEKITTRQYKNYGYVPHYFGYLLSTALESFFSAIESEIYWENPYGKEPIENLQSSTFGGEKTIIHRNQMNILWNEAESRTFDKKRVKMFVKN